MSTVSGAFIKAMGKPNPRLPAELRFPSLMDEVAWDAFYPKVGAGWFCERFYYLFASGVATLSKCLDEWSFIVPSNPKRVILGRNAHGAIVTVEPRSTRRGAETYIHVLDPIGFRWWTNPNAVFANFFGYWMASKALPRGFMDETAYSEWRAQSGRYLKEDEILAIKVPLALGGSLTLDNFQVENIFEYYASTAPIFRRALEKEGTALPAPTGKGAPSPKSRTKGKARSNKVRNR